jgi:hypothetical protein
VEEEETQSRRMGGGGGSYLSINRASGASDFAKDFNPSSEGNSGHKKALNPFTLLHQRPSGTSSHQTSLAAVTRFDPADASALLEGEADADDAVGEVAVGMGDGDAAADIRPSELNERKDANSSFVQVKQPERTLLPSI